MGCDIHTYVEYRSKVPDSSGQWYNFGGDLCLGRYYPIFARLAGVRDYKDTPHIAPRGMPERLGFATKYSLDRWGGDAHDISWLTPGEWESALEGIEDIDYEAVTFLLKFLESKDFEARVVFWFDS
jgi:hypothetical protein